VETTPKPQEQEQEQAHDHGHAPETHKDNEGAEATASTYEEAKKRHQENLDHLTKLLDEGSKAKAEDTRFGIAWPNTCGWLKANKTSLHALTETHDATARATALGKADKKAMFGIDTAWPTTSEYKESDQSDQTNIYLANPSWLGFRRSGSPSKVVIIEPTKKTDDLVRETMVHEVQHDADHHGGDDWDRYVTEFRAYWIDGTYRTYSADAGTADDTMTAKDGTKLEGFDNARQQKIFSHLYNSASYQYVKDGWSAGGDFKTKALATTKPTGINLTNSSRADDLLLAVNAGKPKEELDKLIEALTAEDKTQIASDAAKADWVKAIDAKYAGDDAKHLKTSLGLA
jgi:hypothetical protein